MRAPIRLAGYQGDASVHTRALRSLAAELDNGSFSTSFTADITGNGRRAADLLSLTATGDLEICYFSASYLSDIVPAIRLLDIPFLLGDRQDAHALLDGELCRIIGSEFETAGPYKLLGWWDNGFRHLTSALRAIRSPADCQGHRLRVMGNAPQHARLFAAIGFEPIPLDVRELMPAIESRSVDAQENPLTNIWNFGIHEHHRWISLTGHLFGASVLLCNAEYFAALPVDHQAELNAAAVRATAVQRDLAAAEDDETVKKLVDAGARLIDLDAAELRAFRDATQHIVAATLSEFPNEITRLLPSRSLNSTKL